ncbi:MAG: helix-turn-helix domain-containing protein [Candidatus Aenigmarchaeota archaeon]|nr:helix-turn-helix domain-containing protein [Candidatus Aenigmarchaeota archaeon]
MKNFCESVFNYLIPSSVRSLITKELIETYGYTQEETAKKLGVTQPAISQYLNGLRGTKVEKIRSNKKMMEWIKKTTAEISSGKLKLDGKLCEKCSGKLSEEDNELKPLMCLMEIEEDDKSA